MVKQKHNLYMVTQKHNFGVLRENVLHKFYCFFSNYFQHRHTQRRLCQLPELQGIFRNEKANNIE